MLLQFLLSVKHEVLYCVLNYNTIQVTVQLKYNTVYLQYFTSDYVARNVFGIVPDF